MIKQLRQFSLVLSVCYMLSFIVGCAPLVVGAAMGASGFAYARGFLEKNLDVSTEKLNKASIAGLKELKMFVLSDELSNHSSKIVAEDDEGTKIAITIKSLTERASKIRIRVGLLGDQVRSIEILKAIEKKL